MKRFILLILAVILIVVGLFLLFHISSLFKTAGQGALQVTANVKSNVYLNDKYVGTTPYCKCTQNNTIASGVYTVRIEPQDKSADPFTTKATVNPGVLTAVERTFLPGSLASAYTLTLTKTSDSNTELKISSLPDDAIVAIDSQAVGTTPYEEQNVTASEHEIEIQKSGFAKKTLKVRTVAGYILSINVILGVESSDITTTPTPAPSTTPSVSPKPSGNSTKTMIKILDTPTDFLRVRSTPGGTQTGEVSPGDTYPYIDEQSGWYEITLKDGTKGWVSSQYAEKVTQ